MRSLINGFMPNRSITLAARLGFGAATFALALLVWQLAPAALPRPLEIVEALAELWREQQLFDHLITSFTLNVEAIAWSTAVTLALAYLTVLPALRPIVFVLSKLRFTGLVGWGFVLTVLARDGHQLKLWMLMFGMVPFFVTSMAAVVAAIPRERFDHARTLGLSELRVVWEVVVRGTLPDALETLRHNAAMGWMMLAMVEGIVRSDGGLGALMVNANKHLQFAAVFALIAIVLAVGVAQDQALRWFRRVLCPAADLRR
jgi:NitT/TauT family transport system permease protein